MIVATALMLMISTFSLIYDNYDGNGIGNILADKNSRE